jgi:vanillate O-demethylase ferredoxin subunit
MHALRRGQQVSITQPLQNFPLTYGRPSYVLAAGGIGTTALVAMGNALRARGADYRFVYGARSRGLMAFVDDLVTEHTSGWSSGSTTRARPRSPGTRGRLPGRG